MSPRVEGQIRVRDGLRWPHGDTGGHGHSHGLRSRDRSLARGRQRRDTQPRHIEPQELSHLGALAGAGVVGFFGNELAAQIRLRAGKRLDSPALIADGNHARIDGFVSLGVVASSIGLWLGREIADPIVGLLITLVIFKIAWDSWRIVTATEPRPV